MIVEYCLIDGSAECPLKKTPSTQTSTDDFSVFPLPPFSLVPTPSTRKLQRRFQSLKIALLKNHQRTKWAVKSWVFFTLVLSSRVYTTPSVKQLQQRLQYRKSVFLIITEDPNKHRSVQCFRPSPLFPLFEHQASENYNEDLSAVNASCFKSTRKPNGHWIVHCLLAKFGWVFFDFFQSRLRATRLFSCTLGG